jgi:hypothetical protein
MCKFAYECLKAMERLTKDLEVKVRLPREPVAQRD